ncbi:c-type cytochrome [Xanthomonas massiliensis]|uniref:c-type cytochrome n=1 Tax=Xanthomonas massiliensis TaxID=1720302 RepID=UPI00082580D0|nr:c-type cytochrome [Xanthomonas massiliensis]
MSRTPLPFLLVIAVLALGACAPAPPLPPGTVQVLPQLPPGRIAAGQARAALRNPVTGQRCIDCHGADGNHPLQPDYPRLAGQYEDYLAHALLAYRDGDRHDADMAPQAAALGGQDIADLAAWFGSHRGPLRDLHEAK